MRRTTRIFLVLALLISLQGAGWPSNALAAKSADGFQVPVAYPSWSTVGLPTVAPIAAGKWTGYFTRDITAENSVSGVSVQATGSAKSDMTLMVDGDGNITGQLGPYHADVQWSASLGGILGSCTFDASWDITSGTVAENAAHLPVFDLQLKSTQTSENCTVPMGPESPPSTSVHFEATTASGGKITGEQVRFNKDYVDQAVANLAKAGAQVTYHEYWELNFTGATVDQIMPDIEQYFLQGIPVTNKYTAIIDWHGNPPGKVAFSLDGETQEVPGEAEVSANFDLGKLPAGKNPLLVTAFDPKGQPSGSLSQDVVIVPLDPWAQKAQFSAGAPKMVGIQNVVIYSGKSKVPENPLELPFLELPKIPVIGGKWGIPPFQINTNLLATSGGGLSEPAPITGQTGLYLGGDMPEVKFKVDGEAVTNLTESALLLDHGKINFKLDPVNIERTVGLLDLFPGISELYSRPVVGDMLKGVNGIMGINLQISSQAKGQGELGVSDDKSQLVFKKGQISPSVQISAQPGINIPLFLALDLKSAATGSFTIRIAPDPGLENCKVSIQFTTHIMITVLVDETYKTPDWQVAQCKQAAFQGQPALVVYLPPSLSTHTQAGSPTGSSAWISQGNSSPFTNGQAASYSEQAGEILVNSASPQSELKLASGPQGRLAFVYTGEKMGDIALRLFGGNTWGAPLTLSESGRLNFNPAVAFDSTGQAVIAWVQPAAGGVPAKDQVEQYAHSWEIAYAAVDSGGKVTAQGTLTQDKNVDFAPQLSRGADGSLWLAWLQSPSANLWGSSNNPNLLMATHWDGKNWSKVETVSNRVVGALDFRLAARDQRHAMIVTGLDTDGDPSTSTDRELFAFQRDGNQWSAPVRLSNNHLVDSFPLPAYAPEGSPIILWQQGENLVLLEGDLQGKPQVLEFPSYQGKINLAGASLVAGGKGELGLLWPGFGSQSQAVWIAYRSAPGQNWQPPKILMDGLGGINGMSTALQTNGDLWTGLAELPIQRDGQNMPASVNLAVTQSAKLFQPIPEVPLSLSPGDENPATAAPILQKEGSSENPAHSFPASNWLVLVGVLALIFFAFLLILGAAILLFRRSRK